MNIDRRHGNRLRDRDRKRGHNVKPEYVRSSALSSDNDDRHLGL